MGTSQIMELLLGWRIASLTKRISKAQTTQSALWVFFVSWWLSPSAVF